MHSAHAPHICGLFHVVLLIKQISYNQPPPARAILELHMELQNCAICVISSVLGFGNIRIIANETGLIAALVEQLHCTLKLTDGSKYEVSTRDTAILSMRWAPAFVDAAENVKDR